ncbi:MAG TPA: indole-3-glycerol phosphate synthase TrpC [Planctomycetia bacterium]|nr:indole-3-glycerol phosphate synthase TrpC [Planctomycetia bacterium]
MARDVLAEIAAEKRSEIEGLRRVAERQRWAERAEAAPKPPDFRAALAAGGRMRAIAEIKRSSPSAGSLRLLSREHAVELAESYVAGGADCLSVLTDAAYFGGSIEDMNAIAKATGKPVLRKDFILDPLQVDEAKLAGASAVLLIAECLPTDRLVALSRRISALGMTPLVEFHEPNLLGAALACPDALLGINNRNLKTLETRIEHTFEMLARIPPERFVVSESGIKDHADVTRLLAAGVRAILIGESLLRAADPGAKLAEVLGLPAGEAP